MVLREYTGFDPWGKANVKNINDDKYYKTAAV